MMLLRAPTVLLAFLLLAATGCRRVPFDYPKEATYAAAPAFDSSLGQALKPWFEEEQSAFYPIAGGMDALGARIRLIEMAESTLDLQYFLIKPDYSGAIIADRLLHAADRGVRVRFLLDDIFTTAEDDQLAVLNAHPNIEVRLFNPLVRGYQRWFAFLWQFSQSNRRMHNKSFIADNVVTIFGGRNIADEYFEVLQEIEFADFDMVGVGPVAVEVSNSFDAFWNSDLSVPLEAFSEARDIDPEFQIERLARLRRGQEIYAEAIGTRMVQDAGTGIVKPVPGTALVVMDPPEKLTNPTGTGFEFLIREVVNRLEKAKQEVVIVTPYFVPGDAGVALFQRLRERGVEVTIVTNSLASTNHAYVHGGYAPQRRPLLESGVHLYEAKVDSAVSVLDDEKAKAGALTLHTKLTVIDRSTIVVGSLNIDPRSIVLNSEMGVFVESERLGQMIVRRIEAELDRFTYKLRLNADGKIEWVHGEGADQVVLTSEPDASWWRRFQSWFVSLLPIEGQL